MLLSPFLEYTGIRYISISNDVSLNRARLILHISISSVNQVLMSALQLDLCLAKFLFHATHHYCTIHIYLWGVMASCMLLELSTDVKRILVSAILSVYL